MIQNQERLQGLVDFLQGTVRFMSGIGDIQPANQGSECSGEPTDAELRIAIREAARHRRRYTHVKRTEVYHLMRLANECILQTDRWRDESTQGLSKTAVVEVEINDGPRYGATLKVHMDHDMGDSLVDIFNLQRVS
jgi:hypothetical protein